MQNVPVPRGSFNLKQGRYKNDFKMQKNYIETTFKFANKKLYKDNKS